MKKVIVILGQTATGKSDLAVKISKKINGEVISADSRQIYKGLDIGTGKITKQKMKGIPHHLLDVADPKKPARGGGNFTVTEYQKLALSAIADIVSRGKIPIICGGTGFYIDAVTKGIVFPEVPPNIKLRKVLEKKSLPVLLKILQKLDPERVKNIDVKNKVRLVRAIEIAKALGKVPEITAVQPLYKFIKIGISLPENLLKKRIEKRVAGMFEKGLLKEIDKLKKNGVSSKRLREFGFEYFEPTPEKVILETLKYAKRQMTWFKRDKNIKWFQPTEYEKIQKYLKI